MTSVMKTLPAVLREAPHAPAVPAAYAAATAAKAEADRKAFEAFRAVDQRLWDEARQKRVNAAVAAAERAVEYMRLDAETLAEEAGTALEAARAAEDRAREARAYASEQAAEAERVNGTGTGKEVTEARIKADTADGVAADREAEAATAQGTRDGLDKDLAAARQALEKAERDLRAARKAAKQSAGTAPYSFTTVRACAAYMQCDEVWDQLTRNDRRRVLDAAASRDMMSPAEIGAMFRAAQAVYGGTP